MSLRHKVPEIARSWERCTHDYRLDLGETLNPERLTDAELRLEQQEFNEQFHLAIPIFQKLFVAGEKNRFRVHASNNKGTILVEDESGPIGNYDLALGSVLHEEFVGTNGAGTTLNTGKALTVYADEHFSSIFHDVACSTAPLISPFGEVAGTLNISTYAKSTKDDHNGALKLVSDAAHEIEATIFQATYDEYHLISIHHQSLRIDEKTSAMLAINDSEWIIGATTSALSILGFEDTGSIIGQNISSILGYSLEDLHKQLSLSLQKKSGQPSGWQIRLCKKDSWNTSINRAIKTHNDHNAPIYKVAGSDPHLKRNADICTRLINKGINMLLMGETGTGKEVWARAIHDSSSRSDKAFITLNCAAIPESLIESELFGYSAGTFTGGLKKGKIGKIEASNGGTLFLDEIGDMPLELQARLLRVLSENEVTPLGQLEPVKVDFNVICATHRDLMQRVEDGDFREDLYYRISGVTLTLSSLRERSDRNEIIKKVLKDVSTNSDLTIDNYTMIVLNKYPWPGNIRQLKNVLHYAASMCSGNIIRIIDLPEEVFKSENQDSETNNTRALTPPCSYSTTESEKDRIIHALEEHRWVISRTAQTLGISRSTLHRKMKAYDLK